MTMLINSGPPGTKKNLVVLGDGFAAADQDTYNAKVDELLITGVFGHDYFYEDAQAFNVYRVNLISADTGVSTRTYDEHGTPTDSSDDTIADEVHRDTALDFIFSGSWAHCWLEFGPLTSARVDADLNTWVPDHNLVVIILNDPRYGGCGGGGFQIVPMGVDWTVMAHEFGHGTGGLADEYCARPQPWPAGEPGSVDLTVNINRATTKWGNFIDPVTPVPTGVGSCAGYNQGPVPVGWSDWDDVGLFEGGGTYETGVYRPAINCRMRGNSNPFCPVCYTSMKRTMDPFMLRTFEKVYTGNFNGDGNEGVLIHNGNSIQMYRSLQGPLEFQSSAVERVPGSWQFQPGDKFYIGDFNGDGTDEVVVFNGTDWATPYLGLLASDGAGGLQLIARYDGSMPGWQMTGGDRFFVGDFNGDGKADLFVFNASNWSIPYLGMLHSTGTGFNVVARHDGTLPGWQMTAGDQFFVGDFDGDEKADLFVFNGSNWSIPYLGMLHSTGTSLTMAQRYDGVLPGWQMTAGDRFYVADFDGDGSKDLYVSNGSNWSIAYLGMLHSTGTGLTMAQRYDGNVPGWQMRPGDQHFVAEVNQSGHDGLFVYNSSDWYSEYLGRMASTGTSLTAQWYVDWIGEWNLGQVDRFEVSAIDNHGKHCLIVHNKDWLGVISAGSSEMVLERIYYRFIHNYRYGRNW
jgi:IgA Peptidase M64/FG-GAP-like repeat